MATFNEKYYCGSDIYDDGSIEEELLNYYSGKNPKYDIYNDKAFYFTSNIRENIINWYPFKKGSSVLEIGGGTGAITGALCDKCEKVISVENSKRRANIIYERHKSRDNLEVYAANIKDVKFDKKFDYVVLIGVFEYSKIFFDTDKPFDDFLCYLKSLINENGKIIIAIENRYGFKYISGCNEDHSAKPFIGLFGYENSMVQTFGLSEWKELLNRNNCNNYKFYYPFPDYKMPSIIYSDKRVPLHTETSGIPFFTFGESAIYDYRDIMNGIIDNNMFSFFANSYFIEISNNEDLSNISLVKFQNNRTNKYKITTIVYDDNTIIKIPYSLSENIGNKQLYDTHLFLQKNGIKCSKIENRKSYLSIEYVNGVSLSEYLYNCYVNRNKKEILQTLDKYYNYLLKNSVNKKFTNPLNEYMSKSITSKANIFKCCLPDVNFSNIIYKNNTFILIDQEFGSNKEMSIDYIMYFSIKILYSQIKGLNDFICIDELFNKYNITSDMMINYDKSYDLFLKDICYYDNKYYKYLAKHGYVEMHDEVINKLNNQINELNDTIINNQNNMYSELVAKDKIIIAKQSEINECSDIILDLNSKISELNAKIDQIKSNKFYKLYKKVGGKRHEKN